MSEPVLRDVVFDELTPRQLYAVLRLRSQVFVVEQNCVYLDLDGLDTDPTCRLLWFEGDDGSVLTTSRVFAYRDGTQIGRIATAPAARRLRLAGRLLEHVLATTPGPWYLHAQAHLAPWYRTFGFEVTGDVYIEDGIPHVPMRRQ